MGLEYQPFLRLSALTQANQGNLRIGADGDTGEMVVWIKDKSALKLPRGTCLHGDEIHVNTDGRRLIYKIRLEN